eukprot:CAMPEP_0115848186 /NCGR_PEP_ID=MMETSP0287-20121206/10786_1 /TAXON_ID=412157 /ORGANISM="Chrysochromulina rotalis, Strain UIO044" /LENGTH=180 /DNA_ID=CAMNT_0003302079 /DNA_START=57 /DNA_END=599 /DNA_ORIENTATION=-
MFSSLIAVCLLLGCDGKRISLQASARSSDSNSRLTALKGAAAAIGKALSTTPVLRRTQAEEMLIDEVTSLERRRPKRGAVWDGNAPQASAQSPSPSQMQFILQADRETEATHMWVKRVASAADEAPSEPEVVVAQKIRPGKHAVLATVLPDGEYIAMVFSSRHGLWRSSPFKVEDNSLEV